MVSLIARCLLLFSVLLMPLGMVSAAPSVAHDAHAAAMPMQHCPDRDRSNHGIKGGIAECTMACASALPAVTIAVPGDFVSVIEPLAGATAPPLLGLNPETLTPPPRRS